MPDCLCILSGLFPFDSLPPPPPHSTDLPTFGALGQVPCFDRGRRGRKYCRLLLQGETSARATHKRKQEHESCPIRSELSSSGLPLPPPLFRLDYLYINVQLHSSRQSVNPEGSNTKPPGLPALLFKTSPSKPRDVKGPSPEDRFRRRPFKSFLAGTGRESTSICCSDIHGLRTVGGQLDLNPKIYCVWRKSW